MHYCENSTEKIIIGAGDIFQLKPREISGNNVNQSYIDDCINIIFPHEVYLTEIKRLTNEEDKIKMIQIFEDLFNENIPVRTTISKFFKFTNKYETESNVAYTNARCASVSKNVRKYLNKTSEYEVGEKLTCRIRFQIKNIVFNTNYKYEIISKTDKSFKIAQDFEGI